MLHSLLIVVLADSPFDFDTSAKVKLLTENAVRTEGPQ